jgi:hypothetical protein
VVDGVGQAHKEASEVGLDVDGVCLQGGSQSKLGEHGC